MLYCTPVAYIVHQLYLNKNSKLRNKQTHIYTCIQREKFLLYISLMVTTNQKCIIDTHKNRESNLNETLKIIIKAQEREKKKEKQKRTIKTIPQINKRAIIHTYQ